MYGGGRLISHSVWRRNCVHKKFALCQELKHSWSWLFARLRAQNGSGSVHLFSLETQWGHLWLGFFVFTLLAKGYSPNIMVVFRWSYLLWYFPSKQTKDLNPMFNKTLLKGVITTLILQKWRVKSVVHMNTRGEQSAAALSTAACVTSHFHLFKLTLCFVLTVKYQAPVIFLCHMG